MVLICFPLLISLYFGWVWIGAILLLMIDTIATTVFPSRMTADTEVTFPNLFVSLLDNIFVVQYTDEKSVSRWIDPEKSIKKQTCKQRGENRATLK